MRKPTIEQVLILVLSFCCVAFWYGGAAYGRWTERQNNDALIRDYNRQLDNSNEKLAGVERSIKGLRDDVGTAVGILGRIQPLTGTIGDIIRGLPKLYSELEQGVRILARISLGGEEGGSTPP